jgi:biotin carboxyl carrier protein
LRHRDVIANRLDTKFVEEHMRELLTSDADNHQRLYFDIQSKDVNSTDAEIVELQRPEGSISITAPHQGTVVTIDVQAGVLLQAGQQVAILEAMKMEFIVVATANGVVREIAVSVGDTLSTGQPMLFIEPVDDDVIFEEKMEAVDLDKIRPDLQEVWERHAVGLDESRPEAVERRRRTGQRTVRENVEDLCDSGSFIEYGALALAAQRRRRSMEELIKISPADGLVAGMGNVNGAMFPEEQSRCMVLAYDYTVLAGTQGAVILTSLEWQG